MSVGLQLSQNWDSQVIEAGDNAARCLDLKRSLNAVKSERCLQLSLELSEKTDSKTARKNFNQKTRVESVQVCSTSRIKRGTD